MYFKKDKNIGNRVEPDTILARYRISGRILMPDIRKEIENGPISGKLPDIRHYKSAGYPVSR